MNSKKVSIDENGNCIVIFDVTNQCWTKPEDLLVRKKIDEKKVLTDEELKELTSDEELKELISEARQLNEMYLRAQNRYMNDVLEAWKYLSLNEVLHALKFDKQPFAVGYCYGWNKNDGDYIDFAIKKYEDRFEVTLNCSKKI